MALRAWVAACAVLFLAACSLPVVNQQADAAARGLYAAVRSGADLSSDNELAEELRTPAALAQPISTLADRNLLGFACRSNHAGRVSSISMEPSGRIAALFALGGANGGKDGVGAEG